VWRRRCKQIAYSGWHGLVAFFTDFLFLSLFEAHAGFDQLNETRFAATRRCARLGRKLTEAYGSLLPPNPRLMYDQTQL
jgi:hypothetical protein